MRETIDSDIIVVKMGTIQAGKASTFPRIASHEFEEMAERLIGIGMEEARKQYRYFGVDSVTISTVQMGATVGEDDGLVTLVIATLVGHVDRSLRRLKS